MNTAYHLHYEDLISSMKGSLNRLKLDYVDLYLIHWPNPGIPLRETMKALEYCALEGYTRYIGVSKCARARAHLAFKMAVFFDKSIEEIFTYEGE